ncbi:DUF771 domain-containing protein [Macrococcus equipercicus]|uniref:DUF771 domain-containing protein n=1 Tax=Macrococcus equipercicus TaxID=69967 RepID=A0A9Q9BLE8_9STAP|nr:DUF771 domain-containing protein [Macrococcus equipercicus]UTH13325.1 DUF771 domain-containing protein [Macrococcus equipercicus]
MNNKTTSFNAVITIPPEYVVIKKIEYDRLVENDEVKFWELEDLMTKTCSSKYWVMKNIVNNPELRDLIESFSIFPKGKNGPYKFNAKKMSRFLDEHFEEIKERAES